MVQHTHTLLTEFPQAILRCIHVGAYHALFLTYRVCTSLDNPFSFVISQPTANLCLLKSIDIDYNLETCRQWGGSAALSPADLLWGWVCSSSRAAVAWLVPGGDVAVS